MSTVAKYWDKYQQRSRQDTSTNKSANLMTDRQAYISFLEVQLEKVTQAVMQAQGFNERIDQIQSQVNSAEDKIINVKRIVKLQQSYTEQQEEDYTALKDKIDGLSRADSRELIYQVEERLRARIDTIEARGDSSFGRPRDIENLTREVDSEMKNSESRLLDLVQKVQSQLETRVQSLENRILETQTDYNFLEKKVAATSPVKSRRGSGREQQVDENFEDRLFTVEKELNKQQTYIKTVLEKELGSLSEIRSTAFNAESTANRIGEDCLHRLQETTKSIREIETLAMATAEDVRGQARSVADFSSFERRVESKVSKALNQMGDLMKKYISNDVKLPDTSIRSNRKRDDSKRGSPKSRRRPEKSPSPRSSFKQKREKSLTEIEEQFRGSFGDSMGLPHSTDRSLGFLIEPKSKSSRRPKSAISSKKRRSSTPRTTKSKKSKRAKSINLSMQSPATTIKSRQMEAVIKDKLKEQKRQENKENRALSAQRKESRGKKSTSSKSKLDKIYQEISAKRRTSNK